MNFTALINRAEIALGSYSDMIIGALFTALCYFSARVFSRIDRDRDELIKLREFVGQQKKENKRLWEVIEEIKKA